MGKRDDLRECLQVTLGRRGNGRVRRQGWILRRHGPGRVQGEDRLEIERLFGPQRAVVVEDRNAVTWRDVVLAGRVGHGLDERDDARPGRAVIPRRERIRRRLYADGRQCTQARNESQRGRACGQQ